MDDVKKGLELLRKPFPKHQIGSLPKPTKEQTEIVKKDYKQGVRCDICKGWHHPKVVHLDYVGHAALTDRLLDADPLWTWEPVAYNEKGLPAFDETGGLWIKLIVCGHVRLGYGHAEKSNFKEIGSREKEVIGDAIRNAAMRFGAALDLWHKGDLHSTDNDEPPSPVDYTKAADALIKSLKETTTIPHKDNWKKKHSTEINNLDEPNRARVIKAGEEHTTKLKEAFKRGKAAEEVAANIKEAQDIFSGKGKHQLGD